MPRRKRLDQEINQIPQEILQIPMGQAMQDNYLDISSYVANHRALPSLYDGCKDSYRRLIYAAMNFSKGKLHPGPEVVNKTAAYHPHSIDSLKGTAAMFVNSGVFDGEGAFGFTSMDGTELEPAALRYVKMGLSDKYWSLIGDLIKEVPFVESPVGAMEPTYIPLPLPLCTYLRTSVTGMAVSIKTNIPNFKPASMLAAYKADNPNLLEPNIDIIMDKSQSELKKLWETGKGKVVYSYKISRSNGSDGKTEGILFEGDTWLFTPKWSKFSKLLDEGKVFYEDLTDANGTKAFIGRVPGARNITIEDIEDISRKICYSSQEYNLNITDGTTAYRIPLRSWIDYTYKNYVGLVTEVNKKRIEKCLFDIKVQEALPLVADYILNKNPKASDSELQRALGIPAEIIDVVMGKPISYLRNNKDTADRIKALKTRLKELKAFDPIKYTEEIINQL